MFQHRTPTWVMTGGFLLTFGAGSINAVGFLGVHHQAITHLTGTISILSTELALSHVSRALAAFAIVASFFFGAFLSAVIIRQSTLHLGRRYGVVLMLESLLLLIAVWFMRHGSTLGDHFAAIACGLQNGMATSYSGAVIRSTHMTGIVTDLGIAFGHAVRGQTVDWFRMRLYAILLLGFICGGIAGAFGYGFFQHATLLFPAVGSGLIGLAYTLYKPHSSKAAERTS